MFFAFSIRHPWQGNSLGVFFQNHAITAGTSASARIMFAQLLQLPQADCHILPSPSRCRRRHSNFGADPYPYARKSSLLARSGMAALVLVLHDVRSERWLMLVPPANRYSVKDSFA